MKKLSEVTKNVRTALKKHSPEILIGVGIAGMVTTTVMAVRSTPRALILIEKEKQRRKHESLEEVKSEDEELKIIDVVKVAWKCYIPSLVTGGVSIACIIGASSVNSRRNAALATAYTLSESTLRDYREKVIETIGDKKEKAIKDAVAKDQIEKNPVSNNEVIITDRGNALCYDAVSGRYFRTDIDKLKKAENELNRRMRDEMYISLNDFYFELGLKGISIGEDLGWNIDEGYIDLDFSSHLSDDGTPCLVINYRIEPRYDYTKLY